MRSPTGIRFTEEEYLSISKYASQNKMSFSDVVRRAVQSYLNSNRVKGYLTLRDISESKAETDLKLVFGQFLDDFAHAKDKYSLIADEPVWNKEKAGRWYYDFAATAHKLADDNELPVPSWCLKPCYFPEDPLYAFDTQDDEFRKYLEENTPLEFVWHNLFLGPNILQRA